MAAPDASHEDRPWTRAAVTRRFLILQNPLAGCRQARRRLDRVVERLRAAGCHLDVRQTDGPDENHRLASQAVHEGGVDAVLAAGGDGTVRSTASALVGTPMPLGIIPVGTGNVMAHEIGLGIDADAVAACLLEGGIATVQTAYANGQVFFLMAGAGFDGRVIAALDPALKRRIGKAAYVWPVVKSLLAGPDALRVRIDGREEQAGWVVATMRRRYAGAFVLAPEASLDSSDIHTVLFNPRRRRGMLSALLEVGMGRIEHRADIADVAGHTIEIAADRPIPVQVDGEPFGTTPVRIEAGGPPLRLIVPPVSQPPVSP
ncbi:MAG: diacylglycerol kinase family lipid kinase [Hyphomicrobiaceae bacterium]|nr:diacylglycerol kinase family lipid kinase [Hyphomicrobiaceae bacterium]